MAPVAPEPMTRTSARSSVVAMTMIPLVIRKPLEPAQIKAPDLLGRDMEAALVKRPIALRIHYGHGVAADVRTKLVGEAERSDAGGSGRAFVVGEKDGVADELEQLGLVAFEVGHDRRALRDRKST